MLKFHNIDVSLPLKKKAILLQKDRFFMGTKIVSQEGRRFNIFTIASAN